MDAPVETHLESTDHAGHGPNKLPELSRSQTNLHVIDGPPPSLKRGKSLRTRPDVAQQQSHAIPPTPLKDSTERPELRSRVSSKMSLFSLFSKPKVEKLRGYAEPGLDTPPGPPRANSNSAAALQKPDIAVRVQNADAEQGRIRPTTSRSYTGRGARFIPVKEPLPPLPTDRRLRPFDPPPLFQVWPQARKHGVLEVSSMTPETSSHKSKSRTSGGLFEQGSNLSSLNIAGNRSSGTTMKTAIRHVASGSISNQQLPEKIFVLTTSGFLLQYANEGPTDRLPERLLQLGKDSAAYASDLIPGRHHVLQIAQAVDQHGSMVSTQHSIFHRFGIRNQAAKKMATNFLIVMPGAQEMDDWMTAIKREIEVLGGKRVRSDSASSNTRPRTGQPPKIDLKKTPSQSHRYNVRRDPSKPSIVTSPSTEALDAFPSVQADREHEASTAENNTPVEQNEAEPSASETPEVNTRPRAPSDTPSHSSSTSTSVEQQQLDKLRSSVRASHSTVATSVTAASRTNSITSTPPSDLSKESSEGARDATSTKVPYRSLSSYTLAKRRSAAPLSLKDAPLPETGDMLQQRIAVMEGAIESPIMGYHSAMLHQNSPPAHTRLSALQAHSVPNLKAAVENESKPEAKTAPPLGATPEERPESFIADLPDPTTWTSKASPSHKTGTVPMPPLLDTAAAPVPQKFDPNSPSYQSPHSRPLRSGSNSFSLPLRVHPPESSPPKNTKRASGEPDVLSPIPAVTTLTAKVDFASRTTIDSSHIPARKSSTSGSPPSLPTKSPRRSPSARLSLFPTAIPIAPPPPMIFVQQQQQDGLKRTPSAVIVQSTAQAPANGMRLARPTSLQVRSDHAPFLSSVRNSGAPTGQLRVTTVPIRSLKPSRSVATMQTVRSTPSFNLNNPSIGQEISGLPTSLLVQPPDSMPSRPPSRTRKGPRSRTSLPCMDFGVPLIGLGPPAPPPQAPLPEIPNAATRPQSPENRMQTHHAIVPIGVAISETIDEENEKPAAGPVAMGLGIRVGGAD